jgi:hypothetical protein
MKNIISLWMLLLVSIQLINAQALSDCEALFKKATDKVRSLRLISVNQGFEMTGSIVVTSNKGNISTNKMQVRSFGEKYFYQTNENTLYQDEKNLVVIQKDQKSIFVTSPLAEKARQNQFAEMMKIQDSLQRYLQVKKCLRETIGADKTKTYVQINFTLKNEIRNTGLESITYWIDEAMIEVKRIRIDYDEKSGSEIRSYEMNIDKVITNYNGVVFEGQAVSKVIDKKNNLVIAYKGFTLIDKR